MGKGNYTTLSQGFPLDNLTTLIGNNQDSIISGRDLNETIIGGDGENVLDGRGGHDTIIGGAGNDTIHGGVGDDQLVATGTTPFFATGTTPFLGRDYLYGEAGNDVLVTEVLAAVYGGDGDDVLIAQGTEDDARDIQLEGGPGNDQYFIKRSVGRIEDNEGANVYNIETASGGKIEGLFSKSDDGQRDLLIVDINHDELVATWHNGQLALHHLESQELIANILWIDESDRQLQVQTQDGHILEFDAQGNGTTVGYTIPGFTVEGGFGDPDFNAAADATFAQVTSITGDERDNVLTGNALNNYISGAFFVRGYLRVDRLLYMNCGLERLARSRKGREGPKKAQNKRPRRCPTVFLPESTKVLTTNGEGL